MVLTISVAELSESKYRNEYACLLHLLGVMHFDRAQRMTSHEPDARRLLGLALHMFTVAEEQMTSVCDVIEICRVGVIIII